MHLVVIDHPFLQEFKRPVMRTFRGLGTGMATTYASAASWSFGGCPERGASYSERFRRPSVYRLRTSCTVLLLISSLAAMVSLRLPRWLKRRIRARVMTHAPCFPRRMMDCIWPSSFLERGMIGLCLVICQSRSCNSSGGNLS